jgi:hypothetical protein
MSPHGLQKTKLASRVCRPSWSRPSRNPATREIRVTFSKEMSDGSWSWSQISDESFPSMTGKVHYLADRKTCVAPVKLAPGKTYVIWLNSQKFGNFRDSAGQSAVPYLLVFETRKR